MSELRPSKAFYFGCWGRVGHGYHDPSGRSAGREATPWAYGIDGWRKPTSGQQGSAAIAHKDGWTALDVYDYTIDSRSGSHSVFLFDVDCDFATAVALAEEFFPKLVARVGPITASTVCPLCGGKGFLRDGGRYVTCPVTA
jgi:hypothetical protein